MTNAHSPCQQARRSRRRRRRHAQSNAGGVGSARRGVCSWPGSLRPAAVRQRGVWLKDPALCVRQSKDCANLVCFLAYSGLRIGEARHVTWADVNFTRRQLHVRGDPETATKNGETRYVPMIPELEQMLIELRAQRPN